MKKEMFEQRLLKLHNPGSELFVNLKDMNNVKIGVATGLDNDYIRVRYIDGSVRSYKNTRLELYQEHKNKDGVRVIVYGGRGTLSQLCMLSNWYEVYGFDFLDYYYTGFSKISDTVDYINNN